MATDHEKIDRETAEFLNRAVNLKLEYEEEAGGIDMCLAMEKKEKKDKITGAIQGMRIAGMTDDDILIKVMEAFHVTREYVLAIMKAQAA